MTAGQRLTNGINHLSPVGSRRAVAVRSTVPRASRASCARLAPLSQRRVTVVPQRPSPTQTMQKTRLLAAMVEPSRPKSRGSRHQVRGSRRAIFAGTACARREKCEDGRMSTRHLTGGGEGYTAGKG